MNRERTLWNLAGRVYHEAIFQASVSSAGSNVARLMERLKSNTGYISRQARMVQILGSFYLLIAAMLPASVIGQLSGGTTHQWNVLVSTFSGTIFLLIQTGYLMILTLLATAEILAPDLYRFPESLPVRTEHAGMLRLMALAREFLLPLGVILLAYPVVAGIASRSVLVGALTLPVSLTHAVATLSLIVVVSWRLRRTLRSASGSDRRASTIRVITMAGYGVGIVLIIAIMQFGSSLVASLLDNPGMSTQGARLLSQILALVPLPTAAASLVGALAAQSAGLPVSPPLWMPVLGTVFYAIATLGLFRAAWRIMGTKETADPVRATAAREKDAGSEAAGSASRSDGPAAAGATAEASSRRVTLTARTPRQAFRRQIFQTASRDTQVLMSLIMPFFMPIFVLAGPSFGGAPGAYMLYSNPVAAAVFGGWLLVMGLTRPGVGTGKLEATLPLRERDRAFPRLGLSAIIPGLGAVIAALLFAPPGAKADGLLLALIPPIAVPVGFVVKATLFGKLGKGQPVVVEEIRLDYRFWKWVVTVLTVLVITGGCIALRIWTVGQLPPVTGTILFLVIIAFLGAGVRVLAGHVFPARTTG